MWSRPPGQKLSDKSYYGAGWSVRPIANPPGTLNAWHTGLLDGTFTYMVRRYDGINWVALFNKSPSAPDAPDYNAIDSEINDTLKSVANWAANGADSNRLSNRSVQSPIAAGAAVGPTGHR